MIISQMITADFEKVNTKCDKSTYNYLTSVGRDMQRSKPV